MLCRLALAGDVSESTRCAEERCGEDPADKTKWEVGFGVGAFEVDMCRRFDTGESCVTVVGIKSLPNLLCTCEWHPVRKHNGTCYTIDLDHFNVFFNVFVILSPPLLFSTH